MSRITLPTYCGSDPMYSSRTKNWFHTQPLLTRWYPAAPFLIGPTELLACSLPVLPRPSGDEGARKEETEPPSTRIQRNSSRQFLVSIGDLWGSGPQGEVQRREQSHAETACEGVRRRTGGFVPGWGYPEDGCFPGPVRIHFRDVDSSSPKGKKQDKCCYGVCFLEMGTIHIWTDAREQVPVPNSANIL